MFDDIETGMATPRCSLPVAQQITLPLVVVLVDGTVLRGDEANGHASGANARWAPPGQWRRLVVCPACGRATMRFTEVKPWAGAPARLRCTNCSQECSGKYNPFEHRLYRQELADMAVEELRSALEIMTPDDFASGPTPAQN